MFDNFKRHDNRKQRLSSWFESERDSDTHAFDIGGVTSSLVVFGHALLKKKARQFDRRPPVAGVASPLKAPSTAR
ncbi:MAG: hypothetical protein Q8S53_12830 [Brevundimonas sp.]|uniref:hypothetical protein n=1 Tax=Brevundimonas sp. TaxID=1871086 RepID=UPI0027372305|nr:hypothetical protein [Brevundimonas sp.]MDP3379239.1 hypothetical protein [Brevundimonas sp.]